MCPTVEYAQLYKENKNICGFLQRCVPLGMPKIWYDGFSNGIHHNIKKSMEIGECAGVPRNYSISELKLCRNLISVQTKN